MKNCVNYGAKAYRYIAIFFLVLIDQKTYQSIDTNRYPMKSVLLHELIKEPQASAVSAVHSPAASIYLLQHVFIKRKEGWIKEFLNHFIKRLW